MALLFRSRSKDKVQLTLKYLQIYLECERKGFVSSTFIERRDLVSDPPHRRAPFFERSSPPRPVLAVYPSLPLIPFDYVSLLSSRFMNRTARQLALHRIQRRLLRGTEFPDHASFPRFRFIAFRSEDRSHRWSPKNVRAGARTHSLSLSQSLSQSLSRSLSCFSFCSSPNLLSRFCYKVICVTPAQNTQQVSALIR